MYASIFENGAFRLGELPDPKPGPGQLLVRPLVCGICGSDLHARHHAHQLASAMDEAGFRGFMNPDRPVVMGHEFVAEVVDYGPGCEARIGRGRRVTALPFIGGAIGVELLGFSNANNGGFAEAMLLDEATVLEVPDHVPTDTAALAEPLAVAVHAVGAAGASAADAFAVHGCGPVGLFIIARLRHLGLGPILAIDPDPRRRAHAERLGADMVIEPGADLVRDWWRSQGAPLGLSDAAALNARRPVAFECVGKPGMLAEVARQSPMGTRVAVVGVCMEPDIVTPAYLLMKEMTLRFVFAYAPEEFGEALDMIAAAPERLAGFVTGHASLGAVGEAFDRLSGASADIKLLVRSTETEA